MPEDSATLREWYLDTFAGGRSLEGKALRNHLVATLAELQRLEATE